MIYNITTIQFTSIDFLSTSGVVDVSMLGASRCYRGLEGYNDLVQE